MGKIISLEQVDDRIIAIVQDTVAHTIEKLILKTNEKIKGGLKKN